MAEQLPTRVSDDDLKHYKRSARRYQLAKARFDVAQEAWDEEQAELAQEYRIDGNARIDLMTGEITRDVEAPPPPSNGHGAAQNVPPTGARA
jgi:hypothetical protein